MNRTEKKLTEAIHNREDVLALEATLFAGSGSTYALLEQGAGLAPEAPALSFFLRTQDFARPFVWSHKEWFARITQTANMLRRQGVQRGDVVAYVLPNLPETHWTIWGGETAGIVFAINPLLDGRMVLELLKAAQVKWIVTLAPTPGVDLWEKVSAIAPEVPGLQGILTVSPTRYLRGPVGFAARLASRFKTPGSIGKIKVLDFHRALQSADSHKLEFAAPVSNDVASYFCTGGTTGLPKIAVRSHRTEVANALELAAMFGDQLIGPGEPLFCGLPLFHVNAQIGTGLTAWAKGGHIVLGTPQGYRAPGLIPRFWEIIDHYRVASFSAVPTVYSALLQTSREGRRLDSLKFALCGAAPLPVELFKRFEAETGIKLLEGYGLTEGGCVSSINPPAGQSRIGSIGLRLPWQDMRVFMLGPTGEYLREAGSEEVGTIVIKGPNLFEGYLNPSQNKGLWIDIVSQDGETQRWLNTGDLGRVDLDGYFWLTGRNKELIIRGGHNIDPKAIEEPLHRHPSVALAAAVGRPDAHAGEVPVAYVQLRPGASAKVEELLAFAQEHISERAAWPKQINIIEVLPTTAVGKIFKPALTKLEIESVCRHEAHELQAKLTSVSAEQDARFGMVLRWQVDGDAAGLAARLDRYTFRHENLSDA